jgi:hypothetical protein
MQAFCCSSVSEALYFFEAAPKRSREYSCLGVRGSFGLPYRCRCCLLPRRYQTQSPHRPLFTRGSRHAPEGARKGQSRHPGLRGRPRPLTAFRPLKPLGVRAFVIRPSTFVIANRQAWLRLAPPVPGPPSSFVVLLRRSAGCKHPLPENGALGASRHNHQVAAGILPAVEGGILPPALFPASPPRPPPAATANGGGGNQMRPGALRRSLPSSNRVLRSPSCCLDGTWQAMGQQTATSAQLGSCQRAVLALECGG